MHLDLMNTELDNVAFDFPNFKRYGYTYYHETVF